MTNPVLVEVTRGGIVESPQGDLRMQIVNAIDHVVLNVRDVEASASWYARVLGMTRHDFAPSYGISLTVS